jgi:hypothetical protein
MDDEVFHVGFTGSRGGLTDPQRATLYHQLKLDHVYALHHGDCIGADEAAHACAEDLADYIVIHPPDNPALRANCTTRFTHEVRPAKPYLDRNHDIVDECDFLIACPGGMQEELRSGTWATVRYAQRKGKPITIIWPDGTLT